MAEIHNLVRELTDVPFPSTGAAEPCVLADEGTLAVAYASAADATAIVVFRQCYASHFGPPNHETFAAHLLADRGLRPYGAFEVESSTWLYELERRNRSHPLHDPRRFQQMRHLVWTFQDSALECGALSYTAQVMEARPDDLLARMQLLLRSSP